MFGFDHSCNVNLKESISANGSINTATTTTITSFHLSFDRTSIVLFGGIETILQVSQRHKKQIRFTIFTCFPYRFFTENVLKSLKKSIKVKKQKKSHLSKTARVKQ